MDTKEYIYDTSNEFYNKYHNIEHYKIIARSVLNHPKAIIAIKNALEEKWTIPTPAYKIIINNLDYRVVMRLYMQQLIYLEVYRDYGEQLAIYVDPSEDNGKFELDMSINDKLAGDYYSIPKGEMNQ